jgi:L,D-peptidoglycan transpeptidase YkuD (ErfK/YbiS/YcfS/YnhG family)
VHRSYDWTNGCIGVTDDEMNEIWELVDDGTAIEIRP